METRVTDQASFILRRRDWRNSSLILVIFTRDYGCIRALARGARRSSSRTPYQPFVMLSINWSGRQELKTLTEGRLGVVEARIFDPQLLMLRDPERQAETQAVTQLHVVFNWFEELKAKMREAEE